MAAPAVGRGRSPADGARLENRGLPRHNDASQESGGLLMGEPDKAGGGIVEQIEVIGADTDLDATGAMAALRQQEGSWGAQREVAGRAILSVKAEQVEDHHVGGGSRLVERERGIVSKEDCTRPTWGCRRSPAELSRVLQAQGWGY